MADQDRQPTLDTVKPQRRPPVLNPDPADLDKFQQCNEAFVATSHSGGLIEQIDAVSNH
jgi:hypothetical protein